MASAGEWVSTSIAAVPRTARASCANSNVAMSARVIHVAMVARARRVPMGPASSVCVEPVTGVTTVKCLPTRADRIRACMVDCAWERNQGKK